MRRKGEKDETVGLTKWVGAKTRAYNLGEKNKKNEKKR